MLGQLLLHHSVHINNSEVLQAFKCTYVIGRSILESKITRIHIKPFRVAIVLFFSFYHIFQNEAFLLRTYNRRQVIMATCSTNFALALPPRNYQYQTRARHDSSTVTEIFSSTSSSLSKIKLITASFNVVHFLVSAYII